MSIALDSRCGPAPPADDRAAELYAERLHAGHVRVDRLFAALLPIQWLAAVAFALWLSPYTWAGEVASIHAHVWAAVALGGLIVALPLCLIQWHPGRTETRHCVAVAQMLVGALLIHVSGGRIETHFHIFGSLAFLALYRDWRVLILASAVVAMDHFVRGVFWPRSVYGIATASPWRWTEHTAWVLFEDLVLIRGVRQSLAELHDLAARQAEAETARASVDRLVEERTAELGRANAALVVEVAERRRAEEEVRERHRFVESLAEANPSIIYLLDLHSDRQVWVNGRVASVLGYSQEYFHERSHRELIAELVEPDDAVRAGVDDIARRFALLEDGGVRDFECRVRHADGAWRWLRFRETALVRDADGRVVQALGTAEDVTDRKGAEQALRVAYDQLEERMRERTDELCRANTALSAEVDDRRAAERPGPQRGPVPHPLRGDPAAPVGHRRRGEERVRQRPLVRLLRPHARRGEPARVGRPPPPRRARRRPGELAPGSAARTTGSRASSACARRRFVSVVPGPRDAAARRGGPGHPLDRHLHRYRGPEARRGGPAKGP